MDRIFFKTFLAMVTGFAVWLLLEPSAPKNALDEVGFQRWSMNFVLALGSAVGLVIGGTNGWLQGSKQHLLRGAALGLIFGAIGAALGSGVGSATSHLIPGTLFLPLEILRRILGIAPIGLFLGAGIGASTLSPERIRHGAIGGLIGGAVSGAIFDPIGVVASLIILPLQGVKPGEVGEVGQVSRAITAIVLSGCIALVISLIERSARSAWIRHVAGRNEGREWPVNHNPCIIGRSETAHVPIFGDPNLRPQHAAIQKVQTGFILVDGGGGNTMLDGQPVTQAPLHNGATIQLGNSVFQFFLRAGKTPQPVIDGGYQPQPSAVQTHQAAYTQMPQMPQMPQTPQMQPMPSAPTMQPALVALDGPLAGQRFPLTTTLEAGRESAGINLSFDSMASRRHASLAPAPGGIQVNDLGSTNGTYLNGQRIQQALAPIGGVVRIGATSFRVE